MSDQEPITYTSFTTLSATLSATLEKDVMHLKECMEFIQETVQLQQVDIDTIENTIQVTKQDAEKASNELAAADEYQSRYRYAVTVVGSAVVGIVTLLFLL